MSERQPTPDGSDYNPDVVVVLLVISPFSALLGWLVMWVQGAEWAATLAVVLIVFFGCLAAAGIYRLRGTAAESDAQWVRVLLSIVMAFVRR